VTELVRPFAARRSAALGLFDFGSIKQSRDDRRRANTDRDARLHQLGSPFTVAIVVVAHAILSCCFRPRPYAQALVKTNLEYELCAAA
jgi:hypothetical protein